MAEGFEYFFICRGFSELILSRNLYHFLFSQWEGLKNKIDANTKLLYAKGCEIEGDNKRGFLEAVRIAKKADDRKENEEE